MRGQTIATDHFILTRFILTRALLSRSASFGTNPHRPNLGTSRQHGFVKRYGLVRDDAMRLHRLWCLFGEVQQDLFLSCLTIGQAYCLLEVLK
jgi:hypothetical protein